MLSHAIAPANCQPVLKLTHCHLVSLQCAHVWDRENPQLICGFDVDRAVAEGLLAAHSAGAFLVRMCSEPGSFAISCRLAVEVQFKEGRLSSMDLDRCVDHFLVDCVDLQSRSMEELVWAHDAAQNLLDPLTNQLHSKVSQ